MILMAKSLLLAFRHRGVEVSAAAIPGVATTGGNWRQLDASTEAADSSSDFPTDDGKLTLSSVSAKVRGKDGVCNVAVPDIINNDDDGDEYDYNDDFDEDDDDDEKVFLRVTATGLMSVSSARRKYMTIKVENMVRYEDVKLSIPRTRREKRRMMVEIADFICLVFRRRRRRCRLNCARLKMIEVSHFAFCFIVASNGRN